MFGRCPVFAWTSPDFCFISSFFPNRSISIIVAGVALRPSASLTLRRWRTDAIYWAVVWTWKTIVGHRKGFLTGWRQKKKSCRRFISDFYDDAVVASYFKSRLAYCHDRCRVVTGSRREKRYVSSTESRETFSVLVLRRVVEIYEPSGRRKTLPPAKDLNDGLNDHGRGDHYPVTDDLDVPHLFFELFWKISLITQIGSYPFASGLFGFEAF